MQTSMWPSSFRFAVALSFPFFVLGRGHDADRRRGAPRRQVELRAVAGTTHHALRVHHTGKVLPERDAGSVVLLEHCGVIVTAPAAVEGAVIEKCARALASD